MRRAPSRPVLTFSAIAIVVLLVLLPFGLAGALGRMIGGIWVSVMSAVMAIVAAMFGA